VLISGFKKIFISDFKEILISVLLNQQYQRRFRKFLLQYNQLHLCIRIKLKLTHQYTLKLNQRLIIFI
jgi:hypothetical protein